MDDLAGSLVQQWMSYLGKVLTKPILEVLKQYLELASLMQLQFFQKCGHNMILDPNPEYEPLNKELFHYCFE